MSAVPAEIMALVLEHGPPTVDPRLLDLWSIAMQEAHGRVVLQYPEGDMDFIAALTPIVAKDVFQHLVDENSPNGATIH
jgi:hypothetical protein